MAVITAPGFRDEEEECHRNDTWNQRQRKQQPVFPWREEQDRRGDERADDGTGVIHCAVKSEYPTARRGSGKVREQSVARRASYAFAHAINGANEQYLRPRRGKSDQ